MLKLKEQVYKQNNRVSTILFIYYNFTVFYWYKMNNFKSTIISSYMFDRDFYLYNK